VDPRIGITLKIIEEQKGSMQFGLTETSRMLGLSEEYLLRLFRREVGKTFRGYLRERRMIRATELMKDNRASTKQIALESGYSDVSNFHRDFKTAHGITPREARLRQLASIAGAYQVNAV